MPGEKSENVTVCAASAEEVLESRGYFPVSTKGISMKPMLRDGIDMVIITRKEERLKKYDVAFFRRGKSLVLHRVIKVLPDGYIIRGDNCIGSDRVAEDDVLGILSMFVRGKRQISVTDRSYLVYSRLIVLFHPVKKAYSACRRAAAKTLRKLRIK